MTLSPVSGRGYPLLGGWTIVQTHPGSSWMWVSPVTEPRRRGGAFSFCALLKWQDVASCSAPGPLLERPLPLFKAVAREHIRNKNWARQSSNLAAAALARPISFELVEIGPPTARRSNAIHVGMHRIVPPPATSKSRSP